MVLAIVAMFVTERLVEKRLGPYDPADGSADATTEELDETAKAAEARGLRYSFYGLLGSLAVIGLLTIAVRGAASRPGDRRDRGHHPVHGQPPVLDHVDLPGLWHLLRDGRQVDVRAAAT